MIENAPSLSVKAILSGNRGDAAEAITKAPATGVPLESWTWPLIAARSFSALATSGQRMSPANRTTIAANLFRIVRISVFSGR
jgi:hypothetical protein